MLHTKSPRGTPQRLRQTAAVCVATALAFGGVASFGLSANASEIPEWDSAWIAGEPVKPGDASVTLSDGTVVTADYNEWSQRGGGYTYKEPTNGTLLDLQIGTDPSKVMARTSSGGVVASDAGGDAWTWSDLGAPAVQDLAASADGQVIADASVSGFYLSTDGGITWPKAPRLPDGYSWHSAAVSADGMTVLAVGESADGTDSGVWVSGNRAESWVKTPYASDVADVSDTSWYSATSSADGRNLALLTSTRTYGSTDTVTGTIEKSTDGGVTWQSQSAPADAPFEHMAMSADGQKVVITRGASVDLYSNLRDKPVTYADNDATFISEDAGITWDGVLNEATGESLGFANVAVPSSGSVPNPAGGQSDIFNGLWFVGGIEPAVSSDGAIWWGASWGPSGLAQLDRFELSRVQTTDREATPAAPLIISITPDSGPTDGGDRITVIGSGFDQCAVAVIDGQEQPTDLVDDKQLTFVTPSAEAGAVDVLVTNLCGLAVSNVVSYTYVAPVIIPPMVEPPVTDPPVTDPPVTNPPLTDPPVTDPPVTDPPVTDPPVTDPPVTNPPLTDPPVTDPPLTDPPVTDPPVTEPPTTDPPEVTTAPPVADLGPKAKVLITPAFEADTGVEEGPDSRGLSLLAILAGLAGLGAALTTSRRTEARI